MTKPDELTLATIADGQAEELFARELERVLENIRDKETDVEGKRKIALTITFAPGGEGKEGDALADEITAKSTLRPALARHGAAAIAKGSKGQLYLAPEFEAAS